MSRTSRLLLCHGTRALRKRMTALLLMLTLLTGLWGFSLAEGPDTPDLAESQDLLETPEYPEDKNAAEAPAPAFPAEEILPLAAAQEENLGKLRTVTVHVYSTDNPVQPNDADTAETAFLKVLSIGLEDRWTLEEEAGDPSVEALPDLYQRLARAELDSLSPWAEAPMEDRLLDFLRSAYLVRLEKQLAAAEADASEPVSYRWRWNAARQDSVKVLFLINRYYGVSVHKAFQTQMNSWLYEGALLISETSLEEMLQAAEKPAEAPEADGNPDGAEGPADAENPEDADAPEAGSNPEDAEAPEAGSNPEDAEAPEAGSNPEDAEAPDAEEGPEDDAPTAFGPDVWHADPSGDFEFRLYDYDAEALSMKAEIREAKSQTVRSRTTLNLSSWEKYRKSRQTIDTFYKVDSIAEEDGKISFRLYMNLLLDGRLYQELKGKISLTRPEVRGNAKAGTDDGEQAAEPPEEWTHPETPYAQDFSNVKIGSVLRIGFYEQDGNEENLREPIEWQVLTINKKKNIGLVVSVKGLETMSYGKPGDASQATEIGLNWKHSYLREWLNGDFYKNSFTPAEKGRIRLASIITSDPTGRFRTKDHVFLLSVTEGKRYMHTKQGLACEATPHALEKLDLSQGVVTLNGYCTWWMREMMNAVKTDRQGRLKANTHNDVVYISGDTGTRFYMRKVGLAPHLDNVAVVRPAMWVKFGDPD